jgi:hypothetical protein
MMQTENEIAKYVMLEAHFELHGFQHVRSNGEVEAVLVMSRAGRDYRVHVDREWLERVSPDKVDQQLESLSAVQYLLEHGSMWIGVTMTGEGIITHF